MTTKTQQSPESENRAKLFANACMQFSQMAEKAGIHVLPFRDPAVPDFRRSPEPLQSAALSYLERHLGIFEELVAERGEGSLRDSPQLIWRALRGLGCVPPADLFDKIEEEDTIEIYSSDCIQLFCNLSFFRFISLSLEELCTRPIPEIVEMPP